MGPINYSLNVQNPMQAFMESAQLGSGMAANQAQKAAAEQTAAAQKNKMLLDQWESRSKEQQSQDLRDGAQIIAAINSGSPEFAQQILAERAAAARNSGDEARAKGYETNAELIKIQPQAAAAAFQTIMAALPGGDKMVESLGKIGKDSREAALAPGEREKQISEKEKSAADTARIKAETNRINAEIMRGRSANETANKKDWDEYQRLLKLDPEQAAAFGRAANFVSKEGMKLSDFNSRQIASASDAAVANSADAGKYSTAAAQIRKANLSGGLFSSWGEKYKEITGDQDGITKLRRQAMEIVNSEAIKALPPGPATDRDITLAREPFPTDKANGEYVANWLDAVSRLSAKKAEYESHKAEFIAKNGGQRDASGGTTLSTWQSNQEEQAKAEKAGNSVTVNGVAYERPASFTDQQWAAYKQQMGVK